MQVWILFLEFVDKGQAYEPEFHGLEPQKLKKKSGSKMTDRTLAEQSVDALESF